MIIAFCLPFVFHFLVMSKVRMMNILIIIGFLIALSVLPLVNFKEVLNHRVIIIRILILGSIIWSLFQRFKKRPAEDENISFKYKVD